MTNRPVRKDQVFHGMRFDQRADVAFRHFTTAMERLAAFQGASSSGDLARQQEAVTGALTAIQDLLVVMLLGELLPAKSAHALGPRPADGASDDEQTVYVLKELYIVLDWLREIARLDSVTGAIVDVKRLVEDRLPPKLFQRDSYADLRTRDFTELADREFLVLLVHFVAARDKMTPRTLLEQLKVKAKYKTFEGWGTKMAKAAGTPHDQRQLMTAAGEAARTGGGLSLAQAAQLSDRSRAVLLRDDPQYFPSLAGLDDRQKIQTLFARVLRSEAFSRG